MIHFAICDDEQEYRSSIVSLISEYCKQHQILYKISTFESATLLMKAYGRGEYFDCLLLDVLLEDVSGIQVAKRLRSYNIETAIVYLTHSSEFAFEAYEVGAIQYMLKPIKKDVFHRVLDMICDNHQEERRRYIIVKTKSGVMRVALRDIIYCETKGNYQKLYLLDKSNVQTRMSSKELFEKLGQYEDFVRCGNSYILNLSHVKQLQVKQVEVVNGDIVQIPRGAHTELKEKYTIFYNR